MSIQTKLIMKIAKHQSPWKYTTIAIALIKLQKVQSVSELDLEPLDVRLRHVKSGYLNVKHSICTCVCVGQ